MGNRVAIWNVSMSITSSYTLQPSGEVLLRRPLPSDGSRIKELVAACRELDVNSAYCYLLLCTHFSDTCIVAECGSDVVGCVLGYLEPENPDVFFCWQIAVTQSMRRTRLATTMLTSLLSTLSNHGVQSLEATVTPANNRSKHFFERMAAELGTSVSTTILFSDTHFRPETHDTEWLIRISPLKVGV
jgi:L-2,4-diaminobutyric acid acetyltransferase